MHVVLFTSDDQTFAIPTRCIVEVIPAVQWRPLPGTESWLRGLFNYRAALLPLLDFGLLLGRDSRPLHRTARILVVRSADPQESETQSARLGLLVERVLGSEQLDVGEAVAFSKERKADSTSQPPPRSESGSAQSGQDTPVGPDTHLPGSPGVEVGTKVVTHGALNLQSLLGPVVLAPTGTIQLVRADRLPAPEFP